MEQLREIDTVLYVLLGASVIVVGIGLIGMVFGTFLGGLRRRLRLVAGPWGYILGTVYFLMGAPVFIISAAVFGFTLQGTPPPTWIEAFYIDGTFNALACLCMWLPGLLIVNILSLFVPDGSQRNKRSRKPAGKRRLSDFDEFDI